VLSILLPPPPLGSGVPVATRGASLPAAGVLLACDETMCGSLAQLRARCWDTESPKRPRSAALQRRAPPRSLRSLRSFPLPFLQILLPFPRQQSLRSRLFVRKRKGGARAQGKEGLGALSSGPWVCEPLR
jgi:hypothetical protein